MEYENEPKFNFGNFVFEKIMSYYKDEQMYYKFTQTRSFNPSRVCRRLEKYFQPFYFESGLLFDGEDDDYGFSEYYNDYDVEEEYDYEDYYEI